MNDNLRSYGGHVRVVDVNICITGNHEFAVEGSRSRRWSLAGTTRPQIDIPVTTGIGIVSPRRCRFPADVNSAGSSINRQFAEHVEIVSP